MRRSDSPSLWPLFAGFWLGLWRNLSSGIEEEDTWRDYWKPALRVDVSFRLRGWGPRRQSPCRASSRPARNRPQRHPPPPPTPPPRPFTSQSTPPAPPPSPRSSAPPTP